MSYYSQGEKWERFLSSLGQEVCVSPLTNKTVTEMGSQFSKGDTCLPIQAYYGHILSLCRQGVDVLYLPNVVKPCKMCFSCEQMMKAGRMLPKVITPQIKRIEPLYEGIEQNFYLESGTLLGCGMLRTLSSYGNLRFAPLLKSVNDNKYAEKSIKILLVGKPYLLFDCGLNGNLLDYLQEKHCRVTVAEHCGAFEKENQRAERFSVLNGSEEKKGFDGIILLSCFFCRGERVLAENLRQHAKEKKVMFLQLFAEESAANHQRIDFFLEKIENWKMYEDN